MVVYKFTKLEQKYVSSAVDVAGAGGEHGSDGLIARAHQYVLTDNLNAQNEATRNDEYKILKISTTFYPGGSWPDVATLQSHTATLKMTGGAWIALRVDKDDVTLPEDIDQILRDGGRAMPLTKPFRVTFRPVPLTTLYRAPTSGYATGKPCWVDAAYPSVPHFGLKWVIRFPTDMGVGESFFPFTVKQTMVVAYRKKLWGNSNGSNM